MTAAIVKLDPEHPEPAFTRCREVIRSGGVIAYPTETFYGLGVDPANPAAVKRLFAIKGREPDQPILILISGPDEVEQWASPVTPAARAMMERHWPGPLTLVFPANRNVLRELSAGTGSIGLRVPGSETTRLLLAFLGTALTGTSANRAGGPSPATAEGVFREVGDRIDLILDGGETPGGRPSTVVDVTASAPRVIREGAIDIRV